MTALITYRPAAAEERPFILNSWLRSWHGTHYAGPLPDTEFYAAYHAAIEGLLSRPGTEALCAVDAGAEVGDHSLFGYLVVERGRAPAPMQAVVHYAYVKEPFRRQGVFKSLLVAAGISPRGPWAYTYRTPIAGRLAKPGGPFAAAVFQPNLARRPAAAATAAPSSKDAHP